jgi:hypothetical protein
MPCLTCAHRQAIGGTTPRARDDVPGFGVVFRPPGHQQG